MRGNNFILWLLGLALMAVGCTENEPNNDIVENPTPQEEYVRLNFISGCGYKGGTDDKEVTRAVWDDVDGSGALYLEWERVDIDSEKSSDISLILSDGEKPLVGYSSPQPNTADEGISHSGLSVAPYEDDAYHAEFKSVNYYHSESLQSVKYCYAVAGDLQLTTDSERGEHSCHLEMPSTFTQTASQEPNFLREHMYMYATTAYKGDRTLLNFKHIPATFRFVITHSKVEDMLLQGASITLSEESLAKGTKVASQRALLTFDWADGGADLQPGNKGYDKVSIATASNTSLARGEKYIAYALALPLANDNALKDATINFSIKSDGVEQVALQIDGAKLADINGSEIYNWVGGKSYTIKINIREDGKASGTILADNRIELIPKTSGIYTLYYEGESGEPLADYTSICTLTAKEVAYYEEFIDVNVAPREAVAIGIYDSAGERQGTIHLSNFKPDYSKQPLYSFGLLSDVHIGRAVINPESDFERALKFFNSKDVALTCICGDITQNGTATELQSYQNVAQLADAPVYTTTGNHDCTTAGIAPELWTQYTTLPVVFERSVERNGGVDHFLFLGMSCWNFTAAYLDYHISWLESKLEEYRDERCFVITHLFFPDRAGNLNDIYPSGNWLRGAQLERLEALCDNYVNSIWFSGHSHWEWGLQKYQDRANIYRTYEGDKPTSGWCVHIPSCGVPITSNGTTRVDNLEGSEGAVVEVYEEHIDILGLDLASGKYLPIATYRLCTTPQKVAANPTPLPSYYLTAADFTINQSKAGATVKDVEGMPNYVEVTFTAKKQGFYVANSTCKPESTKVSITVEDVQAFSNGKAIDVPPYVGFYGGDYYLVSTESAEVIKNDTYHGVQFQTSNSKYGDGPLPLTLRMKIQMFFN